MKSKSLSMCLLAAFLCLFAGLLVCGGSRLIAVSERNPLPACKKMVVSYLSSAVSQSAQMEGETASRRAEHSVKDAAMYLVVHGQEGVQIAADCDSNGNVLRCGTYMRSVYQAFDLGDGFA